MSLPKISHPTYFLTVPSTGKSVKFRPFLVKEEKLILIAMQEQSEAVMFEAVKDVIRNCTFDAFPVEQLTLFDFEWIFLQIRIKSKGSMSHLTFECSNDVDGKPCGNQIGIDFNLETIEMFVDPSQSKKIMITDTVGLQMKYPTFADAQVLQKVLNSESAVGEVYKAMTAFVDCVFDGDAVETEIDADEFAEWLEGLSDEQFTKIKDFFDKMPKLRAEIKIKCPKCGYEEVVVLEGLQSFLA